MALICWLKVTSDIDKAAFPIEPPTAEKTDGYTPKEQELIRQLVQERLNKKNAIEFESLDDYVSDRIDTARGTLLY